MTDYLTVTEVLAIDDDPIDRYGEAHGLRDPGQLESAVFRPQTGYYPDDAEPVTIAPFDAIPFSLGDLWP